MKKLDKLLVVDFSIAMAGPFAAQCLCDHGARVIKIESPNGDVIRAAYPIGKHGEPYYFDAANRGKENACLNLKLEEDLIVAKEIIKRADVLIENFRPGVMERLGLGYNVVKTLNPGIIYASVSGFGHTGPNSHRACFDLVAQAYSGLMATNAISETGPLRVGFSVADVTAGMWAYMAIMTALFARERTGKGDYIDIAMVDALFAMQMVPVITYTTLGLEPHRRENESNVSAPFGALKTKNGHLVVAVVGNKLWQAFCVAISREDLINHAYFAEPEDRLSNRDTLRETLSGIFIQQTTDYWLEVLEKAGVPCGSINTIADICHSEQVAARRMLINVDGIQEPATPMKFASESTDYSLVAHVAAQGEHTETIRSEFFPK